MEANEADCLKVYPRKTINNAIRDKNLSYCLAATAKVHGHYCPGSVLGVIASVFGISHPEIENVYSEGFENLVAIVETNGCFADGVQVVSGCTIGNNALVY